MLLVLGLGGFREKAKGPDNKRLIEITVGRVITCQVMSAELSHDIVQAFYDTDGDASMECKSASNKVIEDSECRRRSRRRDYRRRGEENLNRAAAAFPIL